MPRLVPANDSEIIAGFSSIATRQEIICSFFAVGFPEEFLAETFEVKERTLNRWASGANTRANNGKDIEIDDARFAAHLLIAGETPLVLVEPILSARQKSTGKSLLRLAVEYPEQTYSYIKGLLTRRDQLRGQAG